MEILDIFKKIASIPHCSGDTAKLQNFIVEFAKKFGFQVEIDRTANILCYKSKREICLQSHYDMVCVGKAPDIEIFEKDGYLMAKDSSLGADNGIGVALMLTLISKGIEAEYLFTNDEEIGLVGATNLELSLKSKKMINLDSEEFGTIYVGCAGGVDIEANLAMKKMSSFKTFYKISTKKFPGGHSGVDIDKHIPNAIKILADFLVDKDIDIAEFVGGERKNSIPSKAYAIVASDEKIKGSEFFVEFLDEKFEVFEDSKKLLKSICGFAQGIRDFNFKFNIPQDSINLAIVEAKNGNIKIDLSARSLSEEGLKRLEKETKCYFESFGFSVKFVGRYPPWEPKFTNFAKEVKKIYEKFDKDIKFKAIHAGLESAIFSKKFLDLEIVSIGPNIFNPHSVNEKVEISSVEKIFKVVEDLLRASLKTIYNS